MRKKRIFIWVICIGLAFGCCLGALIIDDMTVALNKVDYYSDDLPDQFFGYRILYIADFHDAFYADQVVKYANQEKPDIIMFLGDMVQIGSGSSTNVEALIKVLSKDFPVYGVPGNHEVLPDHSREIIQRLQSSGMKVLSNEKVTFEINGAGIDLIGVNDVKEEDWQISADSWFIEQMRVYLNAVVDPSRFTLLACHRPNLYPYLSDINATLMLSGHVHGGVVRLPVVGGLFDSDNTLLPSYDKGFYYEGNMDLYVDSGCDYNLKKLRVFNGPSITLMTLKK